ncbi:MAG TPA: hypothetical protein VFS71_10330 [Flavobacterium sp.]|uniref:hypothetical protein n=1 Tax=Flavobacterium sp. TaxID=239 RepID=UPI002DB94B5D|nr:hypothetical protein [Flavobacterium sp.]HEU4790073.1 hypothetical protein [Flavobacterium sp.]
MENNNPNIKEEADFNDIPSKSISKEVNEKNIEQLTEPFADNKEQLAETLTDIEKLTEPVAEIIETLDDDFINTPAKVDAMDEYSKEFILRNKQDCGSKKIRFTIEDALLNTTFHTKRDECFILVYNYLRENPPERNDFIKYLVAYNESGVKLKGKYFKYDLEILKKYYEKADKKKKDGDLYNPFNIKAYRNYVFYMILKLHGEYIDSDDQLFNVSTKGSREYNPATKIPSILRGFLPIEIKEYDIKSAFPTFIDMELGTDFRNECYEKLDKKAFAKALNAHSTKPNKDYYYKCIEQLEKVYGGRAFEVLTEERFSEKGRAFRDLTKYEKEFIEQFIIENNEK